LQAFGSELKVTSASRFRQQDAVLPNYLYAFHEMWRTTGVASMGAMGVNPAVARIMTPPDYVFVPVGDEKSNWRAALEDIIKAPPAFYCLNDHFDESQVGSVLPVLQDFFARLDL
jgi:hypothetical protein